MKRAPEYSGPRPAAWHVRYPSGSLSATTTRAAAHVELAMLAHRLPADRLVVIRAEYCPVPGCDTYGTRWVRTHRNRLAGVVTEPCPAHREPEHCEEPLDRALALAQLRANHEGRMHWIRQELPLATLWPEAPLPTAAEVEAAIASLREASSLDVGAPPAARPVFAGVSLDDLVSAYTDDKCRDHKDGSAEMCCIASGLCAVLARLEVTLVAPVDPEAVALRLRDHAREIGLHPQREPADYLDSLARLVRVIFRAAGVPVTPERGK